MITMKGRQDMRKLMVKVPKEKVNYIERLDYERCFIKDVIQRIIESHPDDPGIIKSETFRMYQKEGMELEAEYKNAVSMIERTYVPQKLHGHKYSWNLAYDTGRLEIIIYCSCEIKGVTR